MAKKVFPKDVAVHDKSKKKTRAINKWAKVLEPFMTTQDMLHMFKVSPMTLFHWREKLNLPAYQVGHHGKHMNLFNREEVLAWAKTHGKKTYTL